MWGNTCSALMHYWQQPVSKVRASRWPAAWFNCQWPIDSAVSSIESRPMLIGGEFCFMPLHWRASFPESNKIGKTPLCAFCGSDTFACGTMEQLQEQGDSQTLPSTNHSRLGLLNSKVHRQVLLSLNRSQQTFNSTNCTCIPGMSLIFRSFSSLNVISISFGVPWI